MFVKTLLAKHGWNVIRIHMKTLQPQVENEILKQFTLQLICDKRCLVSELSLILITIKPLIYNVPGLKCHLIIPPTLVLVDHFSYLTRNILTYTVQIHAIVNPHTQKTIHKLRISLFICRNLCWSGGWNTETCIIRKWTLPFINFDVFHYFSSSRQNIFR